MTEKKERKPELRFKGFEGEWVQHKIGDLLIERNIQSPQSNEYPLMAFIANKGVVPKGERYDRSFLVNDTENKLYKQTEYGDFIYSSNNLESGSIGLNKYGNASISPVYSIFTPSGITESDFIGHRLICKDIINEMIKWRQGVIYGQWKIHESDFINIDVLIPSIAEQKRIGTYLDILDIFLTHNQHKYDQLQNLKKAMLEKMFPRNGADVPEIRFKGFEGAWDVVELGKLTVEVVRKAPEESAAPIMMISAASGFINQSEKYSTDNAGSSLKNYTLLKKGELSYNHGYSKLRNYGSCFELREEEARVPFVYHSFSLPEDDATFYSQYLNSGIFDKELKKRVSSTARMDGLLNISYESYMTLNVGHPCFEEQKKIANYFQNLDALISHQQKKIEHLKHLKSALLEKMFVSEKAS